MSNQYPATHSQTLYQADPNVFHTLQSIRHRIHHICSTHVNRMVRIQTLDGHVYEGVIVSCDHGHLYLRLSHPGAHRAYGPFTGPGPFTGSGPFTGRILPLVLYDLLVISLL